MKLLRAFDGGAISSDLLGAADRAIGLIDRFAARFHAVRCPELVDLYADRTSTATMRANHAAVVCFDGLRADVCRAANWAGLHAICEGKLLHHRLKLLKIGAFVRISARHVDHGSRLL